MIECNYSPRYVRDEVLAVTAELGFLERRVVWDPGIYKRGNYFQSEINQVFQLSFSERLCGNILDIGCGDGEYTNQLARTIKHGQILGIDSSLDMIQYANQHWACENLIFEKHRIEDFQRSCSFDFIVSFWCLHWSDITVSFANAFDALKHGGEFFAVFSSFSDNSILQTWHELSQQKGYHELKEIYNASNNQYQQFFYDVVNRFNQLSFKHVKLNLKTTYTFFPNIDYFKNLLLTMPFMMAFSIDKRSQLIEDMSTVFQKMCQQKYGGQLYYETRPVFLEAFK